MVEADPIVLVNPPSSRTSKRYIGSSVPIATLFSKVPKPVTLKVPVVVPPETNMPSLVVSIFFESLNLNSELDPLLKTA